MTSEPPARSPDLFRTVLFTPATRTDRWLKALEGPADACVADLEDAVAPAEKERARRLVVEALGSPPATRAKVCVRINGGESRWWESDLDAVLSSRRAPDVLVLPKIEDPGWVREVGHRLTEAGSPSRLAVFVESAMGIERAADIVTAHGRLAAILFGAEDYLASVGGRRSESGEEVLYARSRVVAAAAIGGIVPIDRVWADFKDAEGLRRDARMAARLGFRGKSVIHPDQVALVHEALRPSPDQLAWARRVVATARESGIERGGVVALEGRMLEPPIVEQARRLIELAEAP